MSPEAHKEILKTLNEAYINQCRHHHHGGAGTAETKFTERLKRLAVAIKEVEAIPQINTNKY